MSDFDFDGWQAQREEARAAWQKGATQQQVAKILKVTPKRAAQVIEKFLVEEQRPEIHRAIVSLVDLGFDPLTIEALSVFGRNNASRVVKHTHYLRQRPEDSMHIDSVLLGVRATNALKKNGITTLTEITRLTRAELERLPGIGRSTADEIEEEMARNGLSLYPRTSI